MSTYVGKLLTSISSALEFNTATLSGAIDIVVIEDDTGKRQCSPFHVRFGKLQLLKSRGIPVNVELNGCPTKLQMLLGAAGEAYFYRPSQLDANQGDDNASQSILAESSAISLVSDFRDTQPTHPTNQDSKLSPSSHVLEDAMSLGPEHISHTSDTILHSHQEDQCAPQLAPEYSFAYVSDSEVELTRNERDGTSEVVDEPRSPPVNSYQRKWNSVIVQNYDITPPQEAQVITPTSTGNIPEYGDDTVGTCFDPLLTEESPSKRPSTADRNSLDESNSQGFVKDEDGRQGTRFEASMTVPNSMTDVVGEEDAKMDCRSVDEQGTEDRFEELQKRVAGVFSEPSSSPEQDNSLEFSAKSSVLDDSCDYTKSLRESFLERLHFPLEENTKAKHKDGILTMSLCGHLLSSDMKEDEILELFERHQVSFSEFERQPTLLFDPALLVKVENRLVEFRVAAAFVFSVLSFREKLDIDTLAKLLAKDQKDEPVKSPPTPSRRFRWFGWSSPAVEGEPLLEPGDLDVLDAIPTLTSEKVARDQKSMDIPISTSVSNPQQNENDVNDTLELTDLANPKSDLDYQGLKPPLDFEDAHAKNGNQHIYDESNESKPVAGICFSDIDPEALSLYPSEEELMLLDLKPGANAVRFIVQSSSVELSCRVFLWSCHTKIVISDVDGTITRSDVLGHLLPAVGRDWSQVGVAGLYTQIEKNGYKLLYLTARPIGQASQTRSFLHSVTQGSAKLPNGPVLMSPNRLVESFTREVIHRKPHEFKITALREIRSLFPPDYNPFHAGFGNRDSDVISYRAVGLIPQRIFVVNPKGELVVTKARYESTASYSTLQDLVESVFPDISRQSGLDKVQAVTESASFNDWNFWKGTLPELNIDLLLHNEGGS